MDKTLAANEETQLDAETIALIRLAAAIAASDEPAVRDAFAAARVAATPRRWVEEVVLQSYLFSGFPRMLNAAREWRRAFGEDPVANDGSATVTEDGTDYSQTEEWRTRGEATCAAVYGSMYERLRLNVRDLHPALDAWMVVDGYGKILGRPGLDLQRRELCIVAACAASRQDRQLHSHLHGALNVGVFPSTLRAAVDSLLPIIGADLVQSAMLLLARVAGK